MRQGLLDARQLEHVVRGLRRGGVSLGRAVVAAGLVTEEGLLGALASQAELPSLDLDGASQSPEVQGLIPERFARQHRVVALSLTDRTLRVAMTAPASLATQDAVRAVTGRARLEVFLASDSALERALARLYRPLGAPSASDQPVLPPAPRHELFDALGLSSRASEAVRAAAEAHGVSSREALQRIIESWAARGRPRTGA
jgi:hypothetical protein